MNRRWGRRLGLVLVAPVLLVLGLAVASVMANLVLTALDRATTPAPGVLADVDGVAVHVVVAGTGRPGEAAVVLLSGLGTPSPAEDFGPLFRALAEKSRVAVVEYPGYGYSGDTSRPRTTAFSVDEARAALKAARISAPYLLVPHSFSGLQALDWVNRYPGEVRAVVGLDPSVPAQLPYLHLDTQANFFGAARALGLVRWGLLADLGQTGASLAELDPAARERYRKVATWAVGSEATFHEMQALGANLKALEGTGYPRGLPVTLILSSDSVSGPSGFPPGVWLALHQDQLRGLDRGRLVILPGGHYIHHGNARVVAAEVEALLDPDLNFH